MAGFIGREGAGFDAEDFDEFICSAYRQLHMLAGARQHIDQRVNRELDGFLLGFQQSCFFGVKTQVSKYITANWRFVH